MIYLVNNSFVWNWASIWLRALSCWCVRFQYFSEFELHGNHKANWTCENIDLQQIIISIGNCEQWSHMFCCQNGFVFYVHHGLNVSNLITLICWNWIPCAVYVWLYSCNRHWVCIRFMITDFENSIVYPNSA